WQAGQRKESRKEEGEGPTLRWKTGPRRQPHQSSERFALSPLDRQGNRAVNLGGVPVPDRAGDHTGSGDCARDVDDFPKLHRSSAIHSGSDCTPCENESHGDHILQSYSIAIDKGGTAAHLGPAVDHACLFGASLEHRAQGSYGVARPLRPAAIAYLHLRRPITAVRCPHDRDLFGLPVHGARVVPEWRAPLVPSTLDLATCSAGCSRRRDGD